MNNQERSIRLRYTAIGAIAALAVVGAIAGTAALAAKPHAKPRGHAVTGMTAKAPASPVPEKAHAPEPAPNPQVFLNAVQRLVDNGTITATEARVLDREILAGRIDTDTLTASGFTQPQLDAVQQALGNTKRALAAAVPHTTK